MNNINSVKRINTGERVFLCLSIVGCRNVVTNDPGGQLDYNDEVAVCLNKMQIAFLLAIGVKHDDSLKRLIDEVYGTK